MTDQIMLATHPRPRPDAPPDPAATAARRRWQLQSGVRLPIPAIASDPIPKDVDPVTGTRALTRLWLGALAEEARDVAPLERMATVLLAFTAGTSVLLAAGAGTRLIHGWSAFVEFAQRLLL